MEAIEILFGILSGLFGLLTSVITYIYKKSVKDSEDRFAKNEKRFDKNDARMDNIENNYLSRFEKLNKSLNDVEKNIIAEITKSRHDSREALGKLQFNTELNYQRKENCLIHGEEIKELKKAIESIREKL